MFLVLLLASLLAPPAPDAFRGPVETEDVLGPFEIGSPGREGSVRIVARYREFRDPSPGAFARTLESWRVESGAGATLHEQRYPVEIRPGGLEFEEERGLSARRITGGSTTWLLVELGESPSAPSTGGTWIVLDLNDSAYLQSLARFEQHGAGLMNAVNPAGDIELSEGRFLDWGVTFGYFSVVFRFELDAEHRRFVASDRCADPVDYRREAEYAHGRVLLHERPEIRAGSVPTDVTAAVSVELLEACLDRPPLVDEPLDPGRPDLWIRVRIDAAEGWVRPEDLDRLGVLFAG